jgi:hypothetical protein
VVAVLEGVGLDKSLEHQARGYIPHKDQLEEVEERKALERPEMGCNHRKDQQQEERKVLVHLEMGYIPRKDQLPRQ